MKQVSIEEWLEAALDALQQVGVTLLGFDTTVQSKTGASQPSEFRGAFTALMTPGHALQIGVMSTEDGCEQLGRALLAMPEDEPFDSAEDVTDALAEISNLVAGGAKTRISERVPNITLGLPLFVDGPVHAQESAEAAVAAVRIGPIETRLVLFRSTAILG